MSELLKFDFEGHSIEAMPPATKDGEALVDANLLCRALGYRNARDAIARHVEQEDVVKRDTPTSGGKQKKIFVKEPGLWALILRANTPAAKRLQRFVSSEVLPAIRRYGMYIPELEVKIAAYIGRELAAWTMLFPPEFWAGLDRLYGVKRAENGERPLFYAQCVQLVYETMDPDIYAEMKKRVPDPRNSGAKQHQALTPFGRSKMMPHVMRCLGLMDACSSGPEWRRLVRSVYGRQQALPLKGVARLDAVPALGP